MTRSRDTTFVVARAARSFGTTAIAPTAADDRCRRKSVKIGDYPALSIDAATNIAKIFAGQVAKGNDPAQERSEKRRKEKATVGSLLAVDGPYERDLTARHIVKKREVLSVLRRGLSALCERGHRHTSRGASWLGRPWTRSRTAGRAAGAPQEHARPARVVRQ